MKRFTWLTALLLLFTVGGLAQVSPFTQSGVLSTSGAAAQGAMFQSATVVTHTITWTVTATVSACTVQFETSAAGSSFALMSGSVAQTCTSSGSYTFTAAAGANYVRVNFTALTVSGGGQVAWTYSGSALPPAAVGTTDGFYWVPLEACGLNLTVGALAAASTTGQLPGIVRAAAGNHVLQISTTAAANTTQLDCDISPPSRLTTGKGVTITGAQVYYGYQTTALTTITGPVVNTVTLPATGAAAAGTVASAGGSLTVTNGTSHSTPGAVTTTGQCYSENVLFGTPVTINSSTVRLTLEEQFAQSAAAATVLQICGVAVFYNNTPI